MVNKQTLSKRISWVLFIVLVFVVALSGCGGGMDAQQTNTSNNASPSPSNNAQASPSAFAQSSQAPKELTEITFSTVGNAAMFGPIYYAQEKDLWKDYGLKIKLVGFDAAAATAALISGDIQIIYDGPAVVEAAIKTNNVKLIGTNGKVALALYAKQMIKLEELKGKTIGVTAAGGSIDTAARTTVKGVGLVPDKDVKFLYTGNPAATLAALSAGKIDAGVLTPPMNIEAENLGLKKVADFNQTKGTQGLYGYLGVNQPFAQKNPEVIKAFIKAYADAVKKAKADKEFTKEVIGKYNKITNPKALEVSFEESKDLWLSDFHIPQEEVQVILDNSKDPNAKSRKVSDILDNQYADALK